MTKRRGLVSYCLVMFIRLLLLSSSIDDGDDEELMPEQSYCMKGIRFGALSAPGPSGARPEHLKKT